MYDVEGHVKFYKVVSLDNFLMLCNFFASVSDVHSNWLMRDLIKHLMGSGSSVHPVDFKNLAEISLF